MVVGLVLASAALAQDAASINRLKDGQGDVDNAEKVLRINSDLVVVDVSVLDSKRNFVAGLDRSSFHIYEDQIEQHIEFFSKESVPVSLGILIDTSGSMRFKLNAVLAAAKEFIKLCRPGDEVFIVDMKDSQRIRFVQPYTANFAEASKAIDKMFANGGTALLDGISKAAQYAQEKASNRRRALIVMTDGDERDSVMKSGQLYDQLREDNVQIYLMGFPEGFVSGDGIFIDASPSRARKLLQKIAEESGGQAYFPTTLDEIAPIASKIGEELRAQYTIGYYPSNEHHDANFRRLRVKLTDNKHKFAVRTRTGYFAGNTGSAQ